MTAGSMFDVSGKAVIVTGAASGIGRAIAEVMAESGARLALLDQDPQGLDSAAADLRALGADPVTRTVDVSDRVPLRQAIDAAVAHFGGLDVVFANAGIASGPGFLAPDGTPNPGGEIEQVSDALWDRVLAVNLDAVFTTIQRAAFHMKPQRSGRIVVTTSVAAFRAESWVGTPYMPAKAGAAHLVRQAALELARYNITVNAIAPGAFATNIGGGQLKLPAVAQTMGKRIPLGRVAQPAEIKGLALFLASPASAFITGAEIPIDGGSSLGR
jgi:NAD(P)-dependent dehydrogenase (short-subunit alcohol dehydrogenase family)